MSSIIFPQKIHNAKMEFDPSSHALDIIMFEVEIGHLLNLVHDERRKWRFQPRGIGFEVRAKDTSPIGLNSKGND